MHNYLSYIADKISQPIRQRLLLLCIIDSEKIFLKLTHFFLFKQHFLLLLTLLTGCVMIVSFGNKETKKIWNGDVSLKLPREIQDNARRKLRMLNNSHTLVDLQLPPSNSLEKLKGDLKEYYSIRINKQWRIVFKWANGNCLNVEIIDYH